MIKKLSLIFFAISLYSLFCACESSAPEIVDVQWQINVINNLDTHSFAETLSFFVYAKDDDGESDLESVYLMHDDSEQYWYWTKDKWMTQKDNGETWIGSSDIVMPDNSPIPRGDYRALVYDASGAKAEFPFKLDTVVINPSRVKFPSISASNGIVTIDTNLENIYALLYNKSKRLMDSSLIEFDKMEILSFPKNVELTRASGNMLYLYAFDSRKGYGVISGPFVGLYDDANK